MEIMKELRKIRRGNEIKQEDVSQYVGVDVSTYSQWEKGRYSPTAKNLEKIMEFLGVEIQILEKGKKCI